MGKNFNIKYVQQIEKYPELYNYTLKSYSKRNITEKAWSEEASEIKLTGKAENIRVLSHIHNMYNKII
jgi:hypothetical protein